MSSTLLQVTSLHKSFGKRVVLQNIHLQLKEHEVLCFVGPSGSGKSTLLRCLNFLELPETGDLYWKGRPIDYQSSQETALNKHRQRTGMVFQHFHLFPHLSVLENIMEGPLRVLKRPFEQVEQEARALLKRVGLHDRDRCYPQELSGGQKQRVAIARALNMQPSILLLDEPTSALDIEMIGGIHDLLAELASEGMTMVLVTHDLHFAHDVAHRIGFLENGELLELGDARKVLREPSHPRFKDFLSQCRFGA